MANRPKGPWLYRFGAMFFTVLVGVLVYWLLGFVVDDIGELRGPQLADVEKRFLDPALVARVEAIDKNLAAIQTQVEDLKARQTILRDSTTSSQQTMNQLLDMQKRSLQNRVAPTGAEQNALARSESLFISNQAQYQGLNDEISKRSAEEQTLEARKRELEPRLAAQKEAAAKELAALDRRHHLRVAGLQLLFLIPILLAAVYFFLKQRTSIYAPLTYAFGIATLTKVVFVIHENFPTRYFKYILLVAALAVVIRLVIYLMRATTFPKVAALLKQYREAYERFLCPICEYPIRRGPLKFSYWNRRSIRKLVLKQPLPPTPDEPYACPSCGAPLFEVCTVCGTVRHTLLPFCDKCGDEKPLIAPVPATL